MSFDDEVTVVACKAYAETEGYADHDAMVSALVAARPLLLAPLVDVLKQVLPDCHPMHRSLISNTIARAENIGG